jgi:hypothetical protein
VKADLLGEIADAQFPNLDSRTKLKKGADSTFRPRGPPATPAGGASQIGGLDARFKGSRFFFRLQVNVRKTSGP